MMKKQDLHRKTFRRMTMLAFPLLCTLAACSGQDEPAVRPEEEPQLSDTEIRLEVADWKPLQESRAFLYGQESFLDEKNNGGNFTLNAYTSDGQTFLSGARAWYFSDTDKPEWRFRSDIDGTPTFPTYYWPNSGTVDFFAYMPYRDYTGAYKDYVTIGSDGRSFSCHLPGTNEEEDKQIEFIYAYETGKTKADNPLHLTFKHPFAAISFKLAGGSYRMTIQQITLGSVHLQGNFSCTNGEQWTSTDEGTASYTASFGEKGITIPSDEMNYNTVFGGPYLMMPQELANVTLTLEAVRGDNNAEMINKTVKMSDLENGSHTEWLPGKKYTYILSAGDNKEEIYFNVEVEDWVVVEHKNEIDVE